MKSLWKKANFDSVKYAAGRYEKMLFIIKGIDVNTLGRQNKVEWNDLRNINNKDIVIDNEK